MLCFVEWCLKYLLVRKFNFVCVNYDTVYNCGKYNNSMMMMGVLPKAGPNDLLFLTYHQGRGSDMSRGGFPGPSSADNGTCTACPGSHVWIITFYTLASAGLSTIVWLNSYAVQAHCDHKVLNPSLPCRIWTTDLYVESQACYHSAITV